MSIDKIMSIPSVVLSSQLVDDCGLANAMISKISAQILNRYVRCINLFFIVFVFFYECKSEKTISLVFFLLLKKYHINNAIGMKSKKKNSLFMNMKLFIFLLNFSLVNEFFSKNHTVNIFFFTWLAFCELCQISGL